MTTLASRKGFTLIELLIVITIIGILAVAFVPSLTGAQDRARDAARLADLQNAATALEFYADDNGALYPSTSACLSDMSGALGGYLTSIPDDPKNKNAWSNGSCSSGTGYDYVALSAGDSYLLVAQVEVAKVADNYFLASSFSTSSHATAASALSGNTACSGGTETCLYVIGR